jgi:site-specific DNA-methyltransferase (cytosine-N4-specific)
VDIFSGSNTTGRVAEDLGRRWLAMEERRDYAALSALRFMEEWPEAQIGPAIASMEQGAALELRPPERPVTEPPRFATLPLFTPAP